MLTTDLASIAAIASEVAAAEAEESDRDAKWPERTIRALQRSGLGGFVVSSEHGGRGHGLLGLVQACELLGQETASAALCFGMHCVGAAVLAAKATPNQVDAFLGPICAGKHLTTLALSEPGSGLHFYYPSTRIRADGDELVLDGQKSLTTNGGWADSYVVSTTAIDPLAPTGMFSCAMVPLGTPGLSWGPPFAGTGMRGNSSRGFSLEQVRIPRGNLLGEDGDQIWYVFHVIAPYFLVAMAGTYLGLASRALALAVDDLGAREYAHNGRSSGDEPVMQHRLGALWAQVERTRRFVYWAATEADNGGANALPALCAAKAEVADCAVAVVNEAMTITGGRGYRDGGVLPRLLRDARAAHVMAPTTDILRVWTGRALLGKPLLSE